METVQTSDKNCNQKAIHDRLNEMANSLMKTNGVKLESVYIDWDDAIIDGNYVNKVNNVNITTSKRGI